MVPSLFICHGAPTLAIQDNDYTRYLQKLGSSIRPKGIIIFTAHWESEIPTVSFSDDVYETIHDFGGFPDEMYRIQYPAKGSTSIASMVEEKFKEHGVASKRNETRGLDHGSWVVLRLLFPNADIPVVQISVNPFLAPQEQYKIGEALKGLGREDLLVIGSGGTSHNLRTLKWDQEIAEPWTVAFDDWIIEHVQSKDLDSLVQYEKLAPNAQLAVPRAEHFVPLFMALGSGEQEQPRVLHRSYQYGTLSHIVFEC